jgi:uncharacterized membrane protein HdeD (DUF308 family)
LVRTQPRSAALGRGGVLAARVVLILIGAGAAAAPFATGSLAPLAAAIAAAGVIRLQQSVSGARLGPRARGLGVSGALWLGAGVAFLISILTRQALFKEIALALLGVDGLLRAAEGAEAASWDRGSLWLILSGVMGLALAALLAAGPPRNAHWAAGLLIAVTLAVDATTVLRRRRPKS